MARPTRNQTPEEQVVATRPGKKRIPLGAGKNVLTADKREGYRRRFINVEGDRVRRAIDAGYTMAEDLNMQVGDSDAFNRNTSGGSGIEVTINREGEKAVLMEIPEEYALEDEKTKARLIDEKEEAITGKHKEEGHYGSVKIV